MNNIIISSFDELPNSHETGKKHEAWFGHLIKDKLTSPFIQHCLNNYYKAEGELISANVLIPESHTEKSDLILTCVVKKNEGHKKLLINGISAKAGKTNIPGHVFSTELNNACCMGLAPKKEESPALYDFHQKWLNEKQKISELSVNHNDLLNWYKRNWSFILEQTLFGSNGKTKASGLLLSNLEVDYKQKNLYVKEVALLNKAQVIEDLKILSNENNLKVSLDEHGTIYSGIFSVQRAGGANGKNPANYWKARMNRHHYLKWLIENKRKEIWIF